MSMNHFQTSLPYESYPPTTTLVIRPQYNRLPLGGPVNDGL